MTNLNTARSLIALLAVGLLACNAGAEEWGPINAALGVPPPLPVQLTTVPPEIPPFPTSPANAPPPIPSYPTSAAVTPSDPSWLPEFVKLLPKPPDEPRSLFQPAASGGDYACPPTTRRYLEADPLLDPPGYPQIGWFALVETEIVAPHIFKDLVGAVAAGSRAPDMVNLPNRGLGWTAAPAIELGYRLPSGFGGFALSYRTLSSTGNLSVIGPDGLAALSSRIAMNTADLDYQTWEFTPDDRWTMRWRFGGRLQYLYYNSVLNQSRGQAASGTGILEQRATNMFTGFGPHASVELTRQIYTPEWRLYSKFDFASVFGRIKQDTSESAFDAASPSGVSWGESPLSSSQSSPQVKYLFGLNWRPSMCPSMDLFLGYQFEYWWNVGRLSLEQGFQRSRGDLLLQGGLLRLQFNY
jgi:hypothetical protein